MKYPINEVKRWQKLAGILNESQLSEQILSPEERKIADDILNTLDEGMFTNVLDKIKSYAKKGLITLAILATIFGSTQLTTSQKDDVRDVVKTEMSSQDEDAGYLTDAWVAYSHYYGHNKSKVDELAKTDAAVANLVSDFNSQDFKKLSAEDQARVGRTNQEGIQKIISLGYQW